MAEVLLDNIAKVYAGAPGGGRASVDVRAVNGVTLHIRDQEFIVLVGPSGCGKSTTLRMVAGLEEISEGTIRIGDRVVNDVPPKDRDIAMVFQNYALYPHMSVYNNMAFGLKLRKMPKAEIHQRIEWAAKILGLEKLLDRKPKALSGGQRQRVAVGRAIVRQPKAFLFDEPLSNLDAKLRVETRAELKRLHQRLKTTTIYVTHDQEEAMTLGDRVVVMDGGEIQQCDTPLNVYHRPVNRFVAGFLGMPPMNFVDGALVQKNGVVWFEGSDIRLKLSPVHAERAAGKVGQSVVLGLRPEVLALQPVSSVDSVGSTIPATINVVEPLGSSMDLFAATAGGTRLVARVSAEGQTKAGDNLPLHVNINKLHVFEPGNHGVNLVVAPVESGMAQGVA